MVALFAFVATEAVAYELLFEAMLVGFVQPVPDTPAFCEVVPGPVMMTLPPTSTEEVEPVIVPPFTRQRLPRVEIAAVMLTVSIVRQCVGSSW